MTRRVAVLALALSLWPWRGTAQEPEDGSRVVELVNLLDSAETGVRTKAGRELLASGRDGIRALLDAAAGRNVVAAEQAREVLTSAGPDTIDTIREVGCFNSFDHRGRLEESVAAVARMGEPVLPRMLETFTTANPAGSDFGFAVGVLLRMNGLAVEPLIPLLKHPKPQVRQEAATLLAQWGDPRAYDSLQEGLGSEDAWVRAECARGLGNIGDRRASKGLVEALRHPDMRVRQAAAAALGKLYEPRFLVPLAALARGDPEIQVRDTASNVLILYSNDPVGVRIGKRYRPFALSPERQQWIELGFALRFGVTGAVLLASVVWLSRKMAKDGGRHWPSVVLAVAVAGGSGYLWGRVVDNLWGMIENQLLFVVVPMVAGVGFLGGKLLHTDRSRRVLAWRATRTTIASFYVGYGIGWLALWGYLGF